MKTMAIDYKQKFTDCKERHEAIFGLTTAPSKVIDSELTILSVNEALVKLMGYSREELEGTKILDYACKEDKPHWHRLQDEMWEQGKPNFKLDACIIKKDGSLAWVHVTTIAFTENGIRYAYTILDDFTNWKELQESENRLKMALSYSGMAVWELDLVNRSLIRSDGFNQLLGYTDDKKEWKVDDLVSIFLDEDQKELNDLLTAIEPGQQFDFQGRIRTSEGIIKWINFQGRAEQMEDGRKRALGTLYDITRDKLAESEKDDFISIASHELKTPLTTLKGALQVLERMKDVPNQQMVALITQASKSMGKITLLVDDLLNASRLNEGQLHLKKNRFNLSSAIDECCLHVTTVGNYDIIKAGDEDVEVEGDSERIQRVIINFVDNAIKYAPKSKEIVIRVDQLEGKVKLSVTDKGQGIGKDKLPYLFDRYYRADKTGDQYSGLGLGLYISAEIIKKHDGEIGVESETGEGSTFWFTLPSN